jgi:glycerol kinase
MLDFGATSCVRQLRGVRLPIAGKLQSVFRRLRSLTVKRRLLLGIDAGTTAVKAALFDEQLQPVAQSRRPLDSRHPQPGWVEQDGEEHLRAVVDAVGEVLAGADDEVVGCGLDHQGESVIAWDAESGRPLSPIVVWQCKRSAEVVEGLRADETEIRRRSGLPLDPYFSAGKLTWLREHVPDGARTGTLDAYLCDRLGAGFATDPSTASRTQLADIRTGEWDEWLCERFGVPPVALPEVMDTVGALGTLSHPDWPVELPLTARLVDQQAALAGTGCVQAGMAKATYGTGVFVLANVGPDLPGTGGALLPTIAWRIAGETTYALDGGVFAAGALLEWLSRDMGLAADPAALCELARTVSDSAGVTVLPAITGLGAPWWKPDAQGLIAGLTQAARPAHVARAALEAIAWRVADVVDAVRQSIEPASLQADGGLSADPLLMQLQADTTGLRVERMSTDSTARGAALLAGIGAGVIEDLDEAASLLAVEDAFTPARGDEWRSDAGDRWRRFVESAAKL